MTQPLALPNYSAISRLPEDATQESITDALGWDHLGSGLYSSAYLSPCGTRVLKVGEGWGSRQTIEVAQENPDNPHLPKVYGFRELDDGGFAVECEVLEHFDDYDPENTYSDQFEDEDYESLIERMARYPDDYDDSPLKDAVLALWDRSGGGFDCHAGNVMLRPSDGALVLNDLLC